MVAKGKYQMPPRFTTVGPVRRVQKLNLQQDAESEQEKKIKRLRDLRLARDATTSADDTSDE